MKSEPIGLFDRMGQPVAFRGVKVEASLAGLLATTCIVQHYENTTADNLEITYTFPLPVDAVLLGFEVELGERRLVGEVVRRSEAEERYEDAVEAGDTAFRLMKLREGLYSAALGNVLPGESVRIHLVYSEPLRLRDRMLRYRLPTTIAPRFGDPQDIPAWQRPQTDLAVAHGFELSLVLQGALAHASVASTTHPIRFCPGANGLRIEVRSGHMDRDFALDLRPGEQSSFGALVHEEDGAFVMLNLLPPGRRQNHGSRDVVILLDCSGSMAGDSIRLAREGVVQSLAQLDPADRFALVRFGSNTDLFAGTLLAASPLNVTRATRWAQATDADLGGTELAAAVRKALTLRDGQGGLDLLLLTDGEAWDLESVADEVRQANAHIFAVGIGAAPAEEVLRSLSDRSGGACDFVTPTEDMPTRIAAHFGRMRQARITTLELGWTREPMWESRPRAALFAGDAVSVFACLPTACEAVDVRLCYADGSEDRQRIVLDRLPADPRHALARTAAHAMLPHRWGRARADWALRYQLVTDETDYIVTLERSEQERAQDIPKLQQTPHMLAAGWGGAGSIVAPSVAQKVVAEAPARGIESLECLHIPSPSRAARGDIADLCMKESAAMFEGDFDLDVPIHSPARDGADAFVRDLLERLDREIGGAGLAGLPLNPFEDGDEPVWWSPLVRRAGKEHISRDKLVIAVLVVLLERISGPAPALPLVTLLHEAVIDEEVGPEWLAQVRRIIAQFDPAGADEVLDRG